MKEPGGTLALGNSERFNSAAKISKESEIGVRTEADGAANDAGMPQDMMLGDAPAPPAETDRTPDGDNAKAKDLKSDDIRTSGSDDSVSMGIGMGHLADDTRNLMKEGVSGSSLTQPDPRSPAAPRANAARDSSDQDTTESSAVDVSKISISGLRVEEHGKGIYYEDLAGSVLVNTNATLRLFGRGLTADSEVLFTAYPADAGDMCGSHLSKAFKVGYCRCFSHSWCFSVSDASGQCAASRCCQCDLPCIASSPSLVPSLSPLRLTAAASL